MDTAGVWSEVYQISRGYYDHAFGASIDLKNDVYLVYMFYDSSSSTVTIINYVSVLSDANPNTWSSNGTISSGNQNGFPTIATTSTSSSYYGVTAWVSYNGSNTIIQYLTGTGTAILPPSDPTVTQSEQDFGIFQEYINTISWSASPSSITTSYIIYRNNIQINEVTPDILSVIDHNAVQDGTVSYSIVASNNNTGEVSTAVTVNYP